MKNKEGLGEKIFYYLASIALVSLWIWSALNNDIPSYDCHDGEYGNECSMPDPRL